MFDKFGEFNSVEELNEAAAGFVQEGDFESLYALARENGIEKEDVDDYLDDVSAFTLPLLICLTICFTYICAQDAPNKFINEMLRLKLTPKLFKLRK